jgi:hypothetical protein
MNAAGQISTAFTTPLFVEHRMPTLWKYFENLCTKRLILFKTKYSSFMVKQSSDAIFIKCLARDRDPYFLRAKQ